MFKLIFKVVIPLALMLTIGLVGYNYFFGTPEEQESSKQIVNKVAGLGADVFDLLKSEKQKFDEGKFDTAIDKIGSSLAFLKEQAGNLADSGSAFLDQIQALEQESAELKQQLQQLESNKRTATSSQAASLQARSNTPPPSIEQIQERIGGLARETEELGMRIGAK